MAEIFVAVTSASYCPAEVVTSPDGARQSPFLIDVFAVSNEVNSDYLFVLVDCINDAVAA